MHNLVDFLLQNMAKQIFQLILIKGAVRTFTENVLVKTRSLQ